MCGIGVVVGVTVVTDGGAQLENILKRSGPDYAQGVKLSPTLSVQATVLHMRGPSLVPQPVSLKNGVFCWNGEVYEMDEEEINSVSDTYTVGNFGRAGMCHVTRHCSSHGQSIEWRVCLLCCE